MYVDTYVGNHCCLRTIHITHTLIYFLFWPLKHIGSLEVVLSFCSVFIWCNKERWYQRKGIRNFYKLRMNWIWNPCKWSTEMRTRHQNIEKEWKCNIPAFRIKRRVDIGPLCIHASKIWVNFSQIQKPERAKLLSNKT
jgi:hypothetical protein